MRTEKYEDLSHTGQTNRQKQKEMENAFPALSKLNEKLIKQDDKTRFITLEEFGVKKISSANEMKNYEEWETVCCLALLLCFLPLLFLEYEA